MFLLIYSSHICVIRFSEYLAYEILHTDLILGEAFCVYIFFYFPDLGLSVYNGLHLQWFAFFFFDGLTEKQRVNCLPHPKHITCFGNSENSCFFLRPLLPSACYAGCEK